MSTASVHWMKERGDGRKITPVSAGKLIPVSGKSFSTGKENPRPTSRVRAAIQKPHIRPIARMSAAASAMEETLVDPRARRSTSSILRGRSSSPSEFTKVLSDMRKNSSRASLGPPLKKVDQCNLKEKANKKYNLEQTVVNIGRICDDEKNERNLSSISDIKSENEKRVSRDLGKNRKTPDEFEGECQENGKAKIRVLNSSIVKKERDLRPVSVERKRNGLDNSNEKSSSELDAKLKSFGKEKLRSYGDGVQVGPSLRETNMDNKVSNFSKENGANKYPSKLHEKLAFLEGRVKRIASDIKKNKDMLDMNNPDASKMILSDIQENISGIEKAMSHVVGNDVDEKSGLVKVSGNLNEEEAEEVIDVKSNGKGLNVDELEARLFPHHKLIRNRTLMRKISGNPEITVGEFSNEEIQVVMDGSEVQEVDDVAISVGENSSMNVLNSKGNIDALLMADEDINEFDDQERVPAMIIEDEVEESSIYQLNEIGLKTSTGGWFVSEGESVLLAHDDGSCSFYDIANCEEKSEYKPPTGVVSPNTWRDCWIIRAPSADGCSGKYVVAASAGNSVDSGFCSWDFYTKEIKAFRLEDETSHHVRTVLASLSNNTAYRRNNLSTSSCENRQWWYKPCGPLIISTASSQKMVQIFDIRDGDNVMKWELQKPVVAMECSSPLHWRNKGKVVLAESDNITLWDVSSISSQALMSVNLFGRKISALHVNNTDAESGGGVRQRISSSEAEGNDGVFCTSDSINVLDFRHSSGIGLKIPKVGTHAQSAFSRGDSIYIGSTNLRTADKKQHSSQIQQFSLRKQKLVSTYTLPESNAHPHFTALTQVWGNSNKVMGVSGLGLFVFDSLKNDELSSFVLDSGNVQNVKKIIEPDDMYFPSFDYVSSRVLVISSDRPALWRYLL